jgi:hypothetical protein
VKSRSRRSPRASNYGTFTLSGAATLIHNKTLLAGFGSFAETGEAVIFKILMGAATGSFALSGFPVQTTNQRVLSAFFGAFTETGEPVSFIKALHALETNASFGLTGEDSFQKLSKATPNGSYALNGQAAGFKRNYNLNTVTGSATVTGETLFIRCARKILATAVSYVLSGQDIARGRSIPLGNGSYTETGKTASFPIGHNRVSVGGLFSLTGIAVTISKHVAGGYGETPRYDYVGASKARAYLAKARKRLFTS